MLIGNARGCSSDRTVVTIGKSDPKLFQGSDQPRGPGPELQRVDRHPDLGCGELQVPDEALAARKPDQVHSLERLPRPQRPRQPRAERVRHRGRRRRSLRRPRQARVSEAGHQPAQDVVAEQKSTEKSQVRNPAVCVCGGGTVVIFMKNCASTK